MISTHFTSSRFIGGAVALAILAGCGGGGDEPASALSSSAGAPGAAVPEMASAAPAAPAPVVTATCGLGNFSATLLARINQLRASGATCGARGAFAPATALAWAGPLTQASEGHSQDMATANYFAHASADGRTLADRVNATGYVWSTLGENIAAGYATVDSVMDGWIASDGHCANLMNPNFSQVGVACIAGATGSAYNTYWTMDLGRPQ